MEDAGVALGLFAFTREARAAVSICALNQAFAKTISEWGFNSWVCARISCDSDAITKPLQRAFGHPNIPWAMRYAEKRYAYDDVVTKEIMVRDCAFYWRDLKQSRFMTKRARAILGEAEEFGWGYGASVPVRLFDGSVWGVTVAGDEVDPRSDILGALEMCGHFYAARAARMAVPERPQVIGSGRLTETQRGIVELLAHGKTQGEIAAELGSSVRMVEKHLCSARARFRAATTSQLVAQAALSGDIVVG